MNLDYEVSEPSFSEDVPVPEPEIDLEFEIAAEPCTTAGIDTVFSKSNPLQNLNSKFLLQVQAFLFRHYNGTKLDVFLGTLLSQEAPVVLFDSISIVVTFPTSLLT